MAREIGDKMSEQTSSQSKFGDVKVHTSQTLAKRREGGGDISTVKDMIKAREAQIRTLLSGQLDPIKFATVAMTTIRNNEKLQKCTPISLVMAVMMAAQRGLSLDPTLGHAYLVPYWNSTIKAYEAQYQTGYQGKIFLAKRDGNVIVDSFVIYKNDTFEITRTTDGDDFKHIPTPLDKDPGDAIGWVARARLEDGRILFEVMRKTDIEKIRQSVKTRFKKDTPAWSEWYDEQGRGKAVNRLAKYLPQSPMLQLDAAQEVALDGGDVKIIEIEAEDGSLLPVVVPQQIESSNVVEEPQAAPQTDSKPHEDKGTQEPAKEEQAPDTEASQPPRGPVSAKSALGQWIQKLRKSAGISQAELGKLVGLNQAAISKIERGDNIPPKEQIIAIADHLAADREELLGLAGYFDEPPEKEEPPRDLAAEMRDGDDQGSLGV
jgi:recombination protein RecT